MKKMSVVLGLLLAVLVMGCGIYESYGFDYKQLSSIERGMSFKEVCTILGEPAFRDLNKEGEAWTFRAYTKIHKQASPTGMSSFSKGETYKRCI